jgi:hypothetical protein
LEVNTSDATITENISPSSSINIFFVASPRVCPCRSLSKTYSLIYYAKLTHSILNKTIIIIIFKLFCRSQRSLRVSEIKWNNNTDWKPSITISGWERIIFYFLSLSHSSQVSETYLLTKFSVFFSHLHAFSYDEILFFEEALC